MRHEKICAKDLRKTRRLMPRRNTRCGDANVLQLITSLQLLPTCRCPNNSHRNHSNASAEHDCPYYYQIGHNSYGGFSHTLLLFNNQLTHFPDSGSPSRGIRIQSFLNGCQQPSQHGRVRADRGLCARTARASCSALGAAAPVGQNRCASKPVPGGESKCSRSAAVGHSTNGSATGADRTCRAAMCSS